MNYAYLIAELEAVSAGCHINDVMNIVGADILGSVVSAGCHINDVMNHR